MIWTGLAKWPDWSFPSNHKQNVVIVSEACAAVIGQYAVRGYVSYIEQAGI